MKDELTEMLVSSAGLNPINDSFYRGRIDALKDIIDYRVIGEDE